MRLRCGKAKRMIVDYLYGELSARRVITLEKHLEDCRDCAAALEQYRSTLATFRTLDKPEPSPQVRERLIEAAELEASREVRSRWRPLLLQPGFATALTILIVMVVGVFFGGRYLGERQAKRRYGLARRTRGSAPVAPAPARDRSALVAARWEKANGGRTAGGVVADTEAPGAPTPVAALGFKPEEADLKEKSELAARPARGKAAGAAGRIVARGSRKAPSALGEEAVPEKAAFARGSEVREQRRARVAITGKAVAPETIRSPAERLQEARPREVVWHELVEQVTTVRRRVVARKQFESGEKNTFVDNNLDAIRNFQNVAILAPDAEYAPEAQYLCASNLKRLNKHQEALNTYSVLLERYPQYAKNYEVAVDMERIYDSLQKAREERAKPIPGKLLDTEGKWTRELEIAEDLRQTRSRDFLRRSRAGKLADRIKDKEARQAEGHPRREEAEEVSLDRGGQVAIIDGYRQQITEWRRVLADKQYEQARAEMKKDNYREAIIYFQNGAIVDKKGKPAAKALQLVAESYYKLGECQEAIAVYFALLEDYPEWPERGKVLLAIGDCYSALKSYDDALAYYELVNLNYPSERPLARERIRTGGKAIPTSPKPTTKKAK